MSQPLADAIAGLRSADPGARSSAAQRLARAGPEARGAAVPLVEAAADEDEEVREWAVAALEELGPPPAEDLDRLAALAEDPRRDVAYWAATLLGRLEHQAAPAVRALTSALVDHGEAPVRQRAAWALGQIGPAAAPALPALQQAADSRDPRLARLARRAIGSIQTG